MLPNCIFANKLTHIFAYLNVDLIFFFSEKDFAFFTLKDAKNIISSLKHILRVKSYVINILIKNPVYEIFGHIRLMEVKSGYTNT